MCLRVSTDGPICVCVCVCVCVQVQALYVDGQHYNALVESVDTEGSKAVVLYEGYDERAEVRVYA